jgi:hypothetical protein
LKKNSFFDVKSFFFPENTPTFVPPLSAIGKNIIFWREIVIYHLFAKIRAILCGHIARMKSD